MAWSVGGWLLMPTLANLGPERVARMRAQVAEGLTTIFATTFSDRVTLVEALDPDRIAAYGRPSTGTKFLITPRALTARPLLEHRMRERAGSPAELSISTNSALGSGRRAAPRLAAMQ